ncbi:MAG: beta-ketoacyl synthase N-terminal-like domain-containing protein, partial [Planctomycetota bacterium]|nr:beta-ketoacyl synthase N-terminal-like domain-containing protein [Planctomycetota bacterium]
MESLAPSGPIAVVGMGCVFPGAADADTFWGNIRSKKDTTREVPRGRWIFDPREALAPEVGPDKVYTTRGCFVDSFTLDPSGLHVDPSLLSQLDPLYHLALEAGRQTWNDARVGELDRERVGVVLAAIALPTDASSALTRETLGRDFENRLSQLAGDDRELRAVFSELDASAQTNPLNARVVGLPAALLAQALGLGGGSYTLDAACASSLYAVKLACDELRAGRSDAMLAGGVSRPECLYTQ